MPIFFGRTAINVFITIIICFIGCFAASEWLVNSKNFITFDPDRVKKLQSNDIKQLETNDSAFVDDKVIFFHF